MHQWRRPQVSLHRRWQSLQDRHYRASEGLGVTGGDHNTAIEESSTTNKKKQALCEQTVLVAMEVVSESLVNFLNNRNKDLAQLCKLVAADPMFYTKHVLNWLFPEESEKPNKIQGPFLKRKVVDFTHMHEWHVFTP